GPWRPCLRLNGRLGHIRQRGSRALPRGRAGRCGKLGARPQLGAVFRADGACLLPRTQLGAVRHRLSRDQCRL
ncbi:MAG: hypothetical protein AVDCRST_MAG39-2146, partial [uncultured Sphingomonadaceae bacterium]